MDTNQVIKWPIHLQLALGVESGKLDAILKYLDVDHVKGTMLIANTGTP